MTSDKYGLPGADEQQIPGELSTGCKDKEGGEGHSQHTCYNCEWIADYRHPGKKERPFAIAAKQVTSLL
jgi:hypothetical protein